MTLSNTVQQHVNQLNAQGFTCLPSVYSPAECDQMRALLDGYWESQGSPSLNANGGFGFAIHPLMGRISELAPFLDRQLMLDVVSGALQDRPRLVHLGARISGPQSKERIEWHHHYGWDPAGLKGRPRIERLLAGIYVDGTGDDTGPFIALPRAVSDALQDPLGDACSQWPGEIKVSMPPGSIALFDTALWHAAQKGSGTGKRRLWGCHIQGWSEQRPHREDNEVDAPNIAPYKATQAGLQTLLGP